MMYKIQVYENPFDLDPILSSIVDNALEAEAAVRNLTEKAQKIVEIKNS